MVKQYYMIHDNGMSPFKVVVKKNQIKIYKHLPYDGDFSDFDEDDADQYDVLVKKINNYLTVFIGEDPEDNENEGNNILVHLKENKYIMICDEIYSFRIKDEIICFKSPVGNNDVPYSYAIGTKNTYLTTYKTFIPNKYITKKTIDPYAYDKHQKAYKTTILCEREI